MDLPSLLGLLAFCAATVAAATTGAAFRPGDWYEGLSKPAWRPPNWLFGPAWAVFYATIAIAGWLVWRADGLFGAALPLALWCVQLALNAAWSWFFFGLRRMDLAFVDVVLLWFAIAGTILSFAPVHAGAALLLVPYLAWVTFAAALNLAIWRRNLAATGRGA